jgi:hypothetical protein
MDNDAKPSDDYDARLIRRLTTELSDKNTAIELMDREIKSISKSNKFLRDTLFDEVRVWLTVLLRCVIGVACLYLVIWAGKGDLTERGSALSVFILMSVIICFCCYAFRKD